MTPREHPAGRGVRFAARRRPVGVEEALKDFHSLNNRGARAAFADHWIGLWARDFGDAWPMLYELLKIVDEDQLYRDPRRVGPAAAGTEHGDKSMYDSFAAYFEDRVGQPFRTWAELESTYSYAKQHAPDLFEARYDKAQAVSARVVALDGKRINAATDHDPRPSPDVIRTNGAQGGTGADYLTRRIVRDHPAIAARMKAGEFTSVRAAALEAGIVARTVSVRPTDPTQVARSLRKHMSPEQLTQLRSLLDEQ